jgi:hypothetical protein
MYSILGPKVFVNTLERRENVLRGDGAALGGNPSHEIEYDRLRQVGEIDMDQIARPLRRSLPEELPRPNAAIPILRISRRTRLRSTLWPSARNSAAIRREPRNGQAVNSSSSRRRSKRSSSFAGRGGR